MSPCTPEPGTPAREAAAVRSPSTATEEEPLLITAREKSPAAVKIQHSQRTTATKKRHRKLAPSALAESSAVALQGEAQLHMDTHPLWPGSSVLPSLPPPLQHLQLPLVPGVHVGSFCTNLCLCCFSNQAWAVHGFLLDNPLFSHQLRPEPLSPPSWGCVASWPVPHLGDGMVSSWQAGSRSQPGGEQVLNKHI